MKRRTFLKAVFAAAVAPASVVRCLYRPEIPFGIDYWILVQPVLHEELKAALIRPGIVKTKHFPSWYDCYQGDNLIRRCKLEDEIRRLHNTTKFQPPIRR